MRTVRLRKTTRHVKGRQAGGYYGLAKDILTIQEDEIPTAKVDYTVLGGK